MSGKPFGSVADRMQYLLDEYFDGHQPTMAAALGAHQPSVSRWVTGRVRPTRKVLHRLEKATGVSADWVLDGVGPVPRREHSAVAGRFAEAECLVPVFDRLLPSYPLPGESPTPTMMRRVMPSVYTATRYFLRMWINVPQLAVRQGDFLLLEGNPEWFAHPYRYTDRLCGVHVGYALMLGVVVVRGFASADQPLAFTPHLTFDPQASIGQRGMGKSWKGRGGRTKTTKRTAVDIHSSELVAVCVRLERDDMGSI